VLESVNVKVSRAPLQDADQFASTFEDLASDVTRKGKNRLIVFIDELDRCTPEDVVSTLVDLKTFLDQPHCIFVVAVDREVLERALRHVPQSNPLREDAPYYSTPGEFIDKIFQHQLSLPPLRTHALTRYARTLVESRSGLWLDLRRHQPRNRLLDDVVYTLIPKHVQSPRRVKVLLNNYATNVRIAQARGINWLDRAPEIAKLTVFQTEFPAFAADLLVQPRLPSLLLSPPDDISQSVKEILQRYSLDRLSKDGDDEHRSAAGELLQDTASPRASYHSAKNTVTLNLRSYLGRTRAAKIPDPRPDLLYLNVAVVIDGISNTELGEVIDFAAETDPVEVAEAFRGQPISAIRDAVRLLAERSDAEFGPGKANLIEAACRLAESLDAQELYQIAAIVSPSVLVASEIRTRADAIPGGLIFGAVGNNSAVIDHMLREIRRLDLDDPTLMRSSAALAYLSTEDATYIHEALVEIYTERPAPLHTALTQLPEREAIALWVSTKDAIDETLASLAKTPGPTETTRPSASVTAGGVPVLPEPDDGLKESTERFSQLLNSVEKRAQYSENLVWQVLRLGQLHAGPAESLFYQVVKQRASDVLPRMQYHAQRNSNVLWAIAYGPHSDWQWWIEFFDSSAKSEEVDLLKAASRLVKSISDPAIDVRSTMPILHTILSAPLSDERRAELLAELQSALTRLDWTDEDCRDRRTALYGVASVADGILEEPTDELLSDDILLAVRSSQHTDALVEQVITLVDALRPAAAGRVDNMLKEYEPPVGEGVSAMRMRIAVRKRSARDPLPIEELVSAATLDSASSSMTLISEWLDSRPEIRDVQRANKGTRFSEGARARQVCEVSI